MVPAGVTDKAMDWHEPVLWVFWVIPDVVCLQ